jgi:hypothetical protein
MHRIEPSAPQTAEQHLVEDAGLQQSGEHLGYGAFVAHAPALALSREIAQRAAIGGRGPMVVGSPDLRLRPSFAKMPVDP